jgi:hypothetical protein
MLADAVLEVRSLADGGGELGTPTPVLQLGRLPEVLHDLVLLPVVEPPDCYSAFPAVSIATSRALGPRRLSTKNTQPAGRSTPATPRRNQSNRSARTCVIQKQKRHGAPFRVLFARLASTRGLKNRRSSLCLGDRTPPGRHR